MPVLDKNDESDVRNSKSTAELAESAAAAEEEEDDEDSISDAEEETDANTLEQEKDHAGILASIAKRAQYEKLISLANLGSHSSLTNEIPEALRGNQIRYEFLEKLVDSGASWKSPLEVNDTIVHRLANISYDNESPRQSLDIYFPDPPREIPVATNTNSRQPVYIYIHGGGWSRGKKSTPFYGGPAMCQHATAFEARCISVSVGYRLGTYPEFVEDSAKAIKWVYDHIEQLGGDKDNVFLSGHSAGAHIASLMLIRYNDFLKPHGIPRHFFRALILVSGVYDLFKPMRTNVFDAKNKWFVLCYVTPAFGIDKDLKREASPLLLLDPDKDTSVLGLAAKSFTRIPQRLLASEKSFKASLKESIHSSGLAGALPYSSTGSNNITPDLVLAKESANAKESLEIVGSSKSSITTEEESEASKLRVEDVQTLPSALILNASFDLGLEENGELMAKAMSDYTDVQYQVIQHTDHASVCWSEQTGHVVADFILSKCVHKPPKSRRGKRDKIT